MSNFARLCFATATIAGDGAGRSVEVGNSVRVFKDGKYGKPQKVVGFLSQGDRFRLADGSVVKAADTERV
jgi:hypothetical protein